MQKILFGIFAHPDDEAFGPAGTLLLETRAGPELHLITLTAGEAGQNPDKHENLADIRLEEWRKAGALIGAASMHHFGYRDGNLNNLDHIEITDRIMQFVRKIVHDRKDIDIEFMSIDLNGVTGHIDHIVASRSACLAFYRLKKEGLPMRRICLACLPKGSVDEPNTDFVFMESGHSENEIGETVDAREVLHEVLEIMHCHHTQRWDGQMQIAALGDGVAINHFIVKQ